MARRFEGLTKEQANRTVRDELLSAYLDGELDAEERARLETRLAADAGLRAELEALRRTVALVRDLPPQPLPRNFILPQTTAPHPRLAPAVRPRWVAPFLTAATAAVSLLFVAVLAGDMLLSSMAGGMAELAAPAPVEKTVLVEKEVGGGLAVTESPEVSAEAAPVAAKEEAVETPRVGPSATPSPALAALPETPDETERAGGEEGFGGPTPVTEGTPISPAGGGPGEETPVPTPTAAVAAAEADVSATSIPPTAEEAEKVAPAPLPPSNDVEATEQALRETEPTPGGELPVSGEEGRGPVIIDQASLWRVAEIALGLAALALVLATIWAWRARRR
jgi:anti-sigma factor RsiW